MAKKKKRKGLGAPTRSETKNRGKGDWTRLNGTSEAKRSPQGPKQMKKSKEARKLGEKGGKKRLEGGNEPRHTWRQKGNASYSELNGGKKRVNGEQRLGPGAREGASTKQYLKKEDHPRIRGKGGSRGDLMGGGKKMKVSGQVKKKTLIRGKTVGGRRDKKRKGTVQEIR